MELRRFIAITIALYLVLYVAVVGGFGVTERGSGAASQAVQGATIEYAQPTGNPLIDEINTVRSQYGLAPVIVSHELTNVADARTNDMLNNQYYSHVSLDGKVYTDFLPAQRTFSCENLDLSTSSAAKSIVNDWLSSPRHRDCLLQPSAVEIGITYPQLFAHKSYLTTAIFASN